MTYMTFYAEQYEIEECGGSSQTVSVWYPGIAWHSRV